MIEANAKVALGETSSALVGPGLAGALIGALTYVTLMLGVVITSMFAFTAAPILDKVFKEN